MDAERIISLLLELVPHARVSEHQPGRIVLKLTLSALGRIKGLDLGRIVDLIPGIVSARGKWLARTIEIDYDQGRLSYDLWESLMDIREKPERSPIVRAQLEEAIGGRRPSA